MSHLILHIRYHLVTLDGSDLTRQELSIAETLDDVIQARMKEDYVNLADKLNALDYEYQDGLIVITLEQDDEFTDANIESIIHSIEGMIPFSNLCIMTEADDGINLCLQLMYQDHMVV